MWLKNIREATHGKKQDCNCGVPNCGCKETPSKFTQVTNMEKKKDPYMEGAPDVGGIGDVKSQLSTPFKLLDFFTTKTKVKNKIKTGKVKDSEISLDSGGGSDVNDMLGEANKYAGRFS
jgi:hypothetical protein